LDKFIAFADFFGLARLPAHRAGYFLVLIQKAAAFGFAVARSPRIALEAEDFESIRRRAVLADYGAVFRRDVV
jgi:hypothetical protein